MSRFERKVLVVDSRIEPIKLVTMEAAFSLLYSGRASGLVESDRLIKGVNKSWTVPWILKLEGCRPKHKKLNGPRFSRQNVYLRDSFRCQYCQWSGPLSNLTLDHLYPCAKGGKTTWDNIVTACKECNTKKGAKTIEELGITIARPPRRPFIHPKVLFPLRYGINSKNAPAPWIDYLDMSIADKGLIEFEASPVLVPQNLQTLAETVLSPKI